MKIDIDFYRTGKAEFIAALNRRYDGKWESFNTDLSLYCACFGLPVIAAITFAEEEFPIFMNELQIKKEVVMEFYDYANM